MTAREAFRRRAMARALLAWFDPRRRPMEWRETRDPYRVWISEIMLQQTTVRAVTPYYRKFIRSFPSVGALAGAPLDKVLSLWEGLGYYARARNLHRAAAIVAGAHGGVFPADVDALMSLPGIGRSTAGAVAALAFGRDEPILDANARRVIARLEGIRSDLSEAAARRRLWVGSRALILPGRGRETALALMDLGSLVCRPADPRCPNCPLRRHCAARRAGAQAAIPFRRPRRPERARDDVVAVVPGARGTILVRRRAEGGLLGGLWELPGGARSGREPLERAVARCVREALGIDVEVRERIAAVRQLCSGVRVTTHAYRCRKRAGAVRGARPFAWATPADLRRYAFPASHRKILGLLAAS